MNKTKKFTNSRGNKLTKALFYETTGEDKSSVVYTLKDKDYKGYPSLKRLYLEEEDITEYNFSNKYLDSYEHWILLTKCKWFKDLVESWRLELKLKLESRYIERLKEIAKGSSKESLQASKVLLDKLKDINKLKEPKSLGRPKKDKSIPLNTKISDSAFKRLFPGEPKKLAVGQL